MMTQAVEQSLEVLFIADPDLAEKVQEKLKKKGLPQTKQELEMLVEESFRAMSQEISFGYAIALGFAEILGEGKKTEATLFRDLIRYFSRKGPTLGLLMARHLPPVIINGDGRIRKKFLKTIRIMESKGTYVMKAVLEESSNLFQSEETNAAEAYLDLICETFSQDINYNQCLHLSHTLPKAVRSFPSDSRRRLIGVLAKVIRTEILLVEPFLEGIEKGLRLLTPECLDRFVSMGFEKLARSLKSAAGFMSLRSQIGLEAFRAMQVNVSFSRVRHKLNRYLQARTGAPLSVKPASEAPKKLAQKFNGGLFTASDGRFIYLPDEVRLFATLEENMDFFKHLTRLEAGLYEFKTFDFDLEKMNIRFSIPSEDLTKTGLDLARFLASFPVQSLAEDLFTVFEHGRIRVLMEMRYPGMARRLYTVVKKEIDRIMEKEKGDSPVFYLYARIGAGLKRGLAPLPPGHPRLEELISAFEWEISKNPTVETSASLVVEFYPLLETGPGLFKKYRSDPDEPDSHFYEPFTAPFNRKIRPDLYFGVFGRFDEMAESLKKRLREKGLHLFKSDLKNKLIQNAGRFSRDDLNELLERSAGIGSYTGNGDREMVFSEMDLSDVIDDLTSRCDSAGEEKGDVFRYREWDARIGDFINDHVRVLDRRVEKIQGDFYEQTLRKHQGLVGSIRYAFELLKPQGLKILKPWVEGDDFDYRAMLDYAIDKKAGWLPSDRLYIKRLKRRRDVAVLLLVDLSKSTSNLVFESDQTVLHVEKEAIVLFCEALEVLGDKSAIAGFSGTGRLGVDYYRIKDFDEFLNEGVKQRINAMSPQRSTRMGAAIRHATTRLQEVESRVRLLILLGDGFPNDLDYKREYAVEDTRKAASEAFSKNIFFRAITVNIAGDPRLDDLYGNVHHSVISDVRQLPDKLLHIYSALTRY